MNPGPPALGAQSLNQWTSREVSCCLNSPSSSSVIHLLDFFFQTGFLVRLSYFPKFLPWKFPALSLSWQITSNSLLRKRYVHLLTWLSEGPFISWQPRSRWKLSPWWLVPCPPFGGASVDVLWAEGRACSCVGAGRGRQGLRAGTSCQACGNYVDWNKRLGVELRTLNWELEKSCLWVIVSERQSIWHFRLSSSQYPGVKFVQHSLSLLLGFPF